MSPRTKATLAAAAAVVLVAAGCPATATGHRPARPRPAAQPAGPVYPLALSANRRYLVDRRGMPFMVVGDSPHSLIGNLSVAEASAYIADREQAGFNALWVELLCVRYTGCRADGKTADGLAPFTSPGDLSTPNPAYFARAATMIRLAAAAGIVVFLDPIETGGWLDVLRANGVAKDRAYGRFVAMRFRAFPNLVWMSGNDFQSWKSDADDADVLAVAEGIRSVDRTHLQTVELNYPASGSLDDERWRPLVGLDAAYTYYPTYAQVLKEYDRRPPLPVFMAEAGYEFEQNAPSISYGDPPTLRRQEYWTMLSGATGQFYGNHYTWPFLHGWKAHLDSPGVTQLGYLVRLLAPRPWFRLVPDQSHRIVTDGYGSFDSSGKVGDSDYVTTAATADGKLAISYIPTRRTIAVDATQFAGPIHAQWYDPTSGTYSRVSGSPFAAAGTLRITTPGPNRAGDDDWVLVLSVR